MTRYFRFSRSGSFQQTVALEDSDISPNEDAIEIAFGKLVFEKWTWTKDLYDDCEFEEETEEDTA